MQLAALFRATACAGLMAANATAFALTVPYTETFESGAAGWLTASFTPPTLAATGGADGGQYISMARDLSTAGAQTVLFRCHGSLGCSGGAFAGDWESNVDAFSFVQSRDSEIRREGSLLECVARNAKDEPQ